MATYRTGDLIAFKYVAPTANDKSPIIIVVAPRWQGFTDGINLRYLPAREREILLRIANPDYTSKQGEWVDRFPALQRIVKRRRADPKNMGAKRFYDAYVRSFAKRYDCFRHYRPAYMRGTRKLDWDTFVFS